MARSRGKRTAAALAGLVVGLSLAEVVCRTAGVAPGRCVFPSRYGTLNEESWLHGFEVPEDADAVRIRDQVVPLDPAPGEVRVLFLGDSGTVGTGVAPSEAYPRQLERRLEASVPEGSVRVINAGAVGMTPVGEYYLLRDELIDLEPDHVVLGLYLGNDINFNLGHQEWRQARARGPVPWLANRSALAWILRRFALERSVSVEPWRVHAAIPRTLIDENGLHMLSYPGGEIATYVQPPSRLVDRAFRLLRSVLRAFVDLGERNGFTFSVVLVPTPSSVRGDLRQPKFPDMLAQLAEQGIAIEEARLDVVAPTERVDRICSDLEIVCVDPTQRMRDLDAAVFLAGDPHPNVAGHRCMANELLARADEWLPDLDVPVGDL